MSAARIKTNTAATTAATATAHSSTNTPAKAVREPVDRRKDHPAPLTDADRTALVEMPFVADAGDLAEIPPRYRSRALAFLREFAAGAHMKDAMRKADMLAWEWHYCKHYSSTFRTTYENLAQAKREYAVAIIEDTLTDQATGNFKQKEGCLPPETRAASVLLPAFDAKYRNSGGTAQQVQINIAI